MCSGPMADDQHNSNNLDDSAIYRLRWITDAMEAARRYAEEHPAEALPIDADLVANTD